MNNIKNIHSNLYFVTDVIKTAEFYKNLGFDINLSNNTARIVMNDFTLAFINETAAEITDEVGSKPKGTGIYTYVETNDVDKQYRYIVENGLEPSSEPNDWSWGKREFAIKDPDGYKIIFYSKIIDGKK